MGLCRYLRVRERNLCVLVFAACLCAVTREVEIKELWDCLEDMSLSNLLLPLTNLYSELLTLLGVVDDVRRAHAWAGANRRCRGARSLDIESRTVLHKLEGLQSMVTFCDSDLGQDFTVLFQITNDILRYIEHQMAVFKGQLGKNLSTIPFHFKTHWDMKLQTWPTAARQMLESRKLCWDLWRQILFPVSPTLHWILQIAPTEAENTMRMRAMATRVKRITLREKGRLWLSSPSSKESKLRSL